MIELQAPKTRITAEQIAQAVALLVEAARPEQIVLFGSHARGDARDDSDLDLLVVERVLFNKAQEMVRLRRALRPLGISADVLVTTPEELASLGREKGSVYWWVLREGRVLHG